MCITVAIVDDHPLIAQGLQQSLVNYTNICLQSIYSNAQDLVQGLAAEEPNVLLLDIRLPDKNGDELLPQLLKKYPNLKVIAHTSLDGTLIANNMLKTGAHCFLYKNSPIETIVKAIETVYNGEVYVDKYLQEKINQINKRIERSTFTRTTLTKRETEILQQIVNGDTTDEIAQKLFLSKSTVENYRTNILLKLNAKNTAQLVNIALKTGLAN